MSKNEYQEEEASQERVHDVEVMSEETETEPAAASDNSSPTRPARNQLSREASERINAAARARWSQYRADKKAGKPSEADTSKAVVAAMPVGEIQLTGTAEGVRRWVDAAEKFGRCAVACQVMAGFELLEVKKTLGFIQGGRRSKGQNRNDCGFASWEEYVRSEIGLSDRTAFNWMRMAESAKPRLKKLAGIGSLIRDILTKPVSELSPTESQLLTDAVHKLTDGRTQLDFLVELGLAKSPQGSAAKGGNLGQGETETPSDEDMRRMARESWTVIAERLSLERESFTLLDDAQVEALLDYTDHLARAMRAWLRTPKAERGPDAVNRAKLLLPA